MIEKLTDVFKKTKDSNIGKLISIVGNQFDDINSTLERMEEWRDIDNAKGVYLDRIGQEIVGEFRGGDSDEDYRLKIRTKIVTNFLSKGDIESINKLLHIYLDEYFVSVQEGWSLTGSPFDSEPAMLFITVKGNNNPYGIPFSHLDLVGTGGVGTQWQYLLETRLNVIQEYQHWQYPFENFAGWLVAADDYERVLNDTRDYISDLSVSILFSTALNTYLICGDYVPGDNLSKNYSSSFELSGVYFSSIQGYPICGNFVTGEVI